MSGLDSFASSAKGLARNPLGIIALFIVLIYGVAALTLGISSLEPDERRPMVWFLVLFPVLVLLTFGWLVSCHHEKLYGPGDYKSDESFLQGMRTRVRHTIEVEAQQAEMKARVLQTLAGGSEVGSKGSENLIERVADEIDRSTTIEVDARNILNDPTSLFTLPTAAFKNFDDLLNEIYFKIEAEVGPFEYGHSWILKDMESNKILTGVRMITGDEAGKPVQDLRTLSEVGVHPGMRLVVERFERPRRPRRR
ncbi:hypothetical protein WKW80_34815 [Variovorax humicola]|uniref:Uncharacterized protein n=1 Tax=Variovorax humicola TaxID=1769758 RepID=A0ABU8WAN2_9BURK